MNGYDFYDDEDCNCYGPGCTHHEPREMKAGCYTCKDYHVPRKADEMSCAEQRMRYPAQTMIVHCVGETAKAWQVIVLHAGYAIRNAGPHWVPKSACSLEGFTLTIPDWLEKKKRIIDDGWQDYDDFYDIGFDDGFNAY